MGGVAQRRAGRQPPRQQVARDHGRRGDKGRARPAAVEHGERRDAHDVRRKAIAGERHPIAPRQRTDRHQHDELGAETGTEHRLPAGVGGDGRDNGEHGSERHERPHEHAGRGLEAGNDAHAGRSESSGVDAAQTRDCGVACQARLSLHATQPALPHPVCASPSSTVSSETTSLGPPVWRPKSARPTRTRTSS